MRAIELWQWTEADRLELVSIFWNLGGHGKLPFYRYLNLCGRLEGHTEVDRRKSTVIGSMEEDREKERGGFFSAALLSVSADVRTARGGKHDVDEIALPLTFHLKFILFFYCKNIRGGVDAKYAILVRNQSVKIRNRSKSF